MGHKDLSDMTLKGDEVHVYLYMDRIRIFSCKQRCQVRYIYKVRWHVLVRGTQPFMWPLTPEIDSVLGETSKCPTVG